MPIPSRHNHSGAHLWHPSPTSRVSLQGLAVSKIVATPCCISLLSPESAFKSALSSQPKRVRLFGTHCCEPTGLEQECLRHSKPVSHQICLSQFINLIDFAMRPLTFRTFCYFFELLHLIILLSTIDTVSSYAFGFLHARKEDLSQTCVPIVPCASVTLSENFKAYLLPVSILLLQVRNLRINIMLRLSSVVMRRSFLAFPCCEEPTYLLHFLFCFAHVLSLKFFLLLRSGHAHLLYKASSLHLFSLSPFCDDMIFFSLRCHNPLCAMKDPSSYISHRR